MNAPTLPLSTMFPGEASFGTVVDALRPHTARKLVLHYAGQAVRPGYHVTEVKSGSFITLDCGGDADAWAEAILQVEDLPASEKTPDHMSVGKFLSILDKVTRQVPLPHGARLTFEVGPPAEAMRVFDVEALKLQSDRVDLMLCPRPAICKPRHRAEQAKQASCCAPTRGCC